MGAVCTLHCCVVCAVQALNKATDRNLLGLASQDKVRARAMNKATDRLLISSSSISRTKQEAAAGNLVASSSISKTSKSGPKKAASAVRQLLSGTSSTQVDRVSAKARLQRDSNTRALLAAKEIIYSASKVRAEKVRAANDRALLAGKVGSQEKILGKATVTTNARRTRAGTN